MTRNVVLELLLPFLGTSLGAGGVFFLKEKLNLMLQRSLTGFAAGVMVAAFVWSLLVSAMERAESMGRWAFLPAVIGFWLGALFCWFWTGRSPTCTRTAVSWKAPTPG